MTEKQQKYIDECIQDLNKMVEKYKAKKGKDNITMPIYDFLIIFEGFAERCSEYSGALEVEEVYVPVLNKYYKEYESIKE